MGFLRTISWVALFSLAFGAGFWFAFTITQEDIYISLGSRADIDIPQAKPGWIIRVSKNGTPSTAAYLCEYENVDDQIVSFSHDKIYYNYLGKLLPAQTILNYVLPRAAEITTEIEVHFMMREMRINPQKPILETCLEKTKAAVQNDAVCVVSKIYTVDPDGAGPTEPQIYGIQFREVAVSFDPVTPLDCPLYNDGDNDWMTEARQYLIKVRIPSTAV